MYKKEERHEESSQRLDFKELHKAIYGKKRSSDCVHYEEYDDDDADCFVD